MSNKSLIGILPKELIFTENDSKDLAKKLRYMMRLNEQEKKNITTRLRMIVVEKHDLRILVKVIFNESNI